ncbi:metallophosphoesterase [Streptomyces sp. NPDC086082]|uniref:metallophosphoesterase n=1 Tax=Streptomyces sp. NPDC086082 TaxID=3365750 RepID=UPI00381B491E
MVAHIFQLSDIHLTATYERVEGRDPDWRLELVLKAYRRAGVRADLVVLTGDLADDGSLAACRRLSAALAPLSIPVLAVPGNHDRPNTVRKVFSSDSATVGKWRVVGIDSSRPNQVHGRVDVASLTRRLDSDLDRRPTILAMHHPPLSPSTNAWFQLEGAADLMKALAQRPYVKAIIAGHLHDPFERGSAAGPTVFGCPSTLIAFRHTGANVEVGGGQVTGARLLALHDDETVTSQVLTT